MAARNSIAWNRSVLTTLFLTFVVLLVPLYLVGVSIFGWSKELVVRELERTMELQEDFHLKNLEAEVRRIKKIQYDFFGDDDANTLVNLGALLSPIEKTVAIQRIQKSLTSIKEGSPLIGFTSLFLPSIQRRINGLGSGLGSIGEIPADWRGPAGAETAASDSQLFVNDGQPVLYAQYPFPPTARGAPPLFGFEIGISVEQLRAYLLGGTAAQGSRTFVWMPGENFSMTTDPGDGTARQLLARAADQTRQNNNGSFSVVSGGVRYLLVLGTSEYLGLTLARYLSEDEVFRPLNQFQMWLALFSVVALLVVAGFSFAVRKMIQTPIVRLAEAMNEVQNGNLSQRIVHHRQDEFSRLFDGFNAMADSLETTVDQVFRQRLLTQNAELRQLQSQINPHFLFNSFYILKRRLQQEDLDSARAFAESLGTYFKFITRSASDSVALAEEVEHARIYAEIQAARFSNRLVLEFQQLPPDWGPLKVPRLVVQPLIENAFEHGLESREAGGWIKVTFRRDGMAFHIDVENNGLPADDQDWTGLQGSITDPPPGAEWTALRNIHRRLVLGLGSGSGLEVGPGPSGGIRVSLRLFFPEAASGA